MNTVPGIEEIQSSHKRISPYIHRTPVLTSQSINDMAGCELYFKCENFQKIGAFKARGALNALLLYNESNPDFLAAATHSSGNHGQAVAYAAKMLGKKAYIVMPRTAPLIKKKAVAGYGAEVIECEPNQAARESTLNEVQEKSGAHFVHPYDDYRVIAGQATCAKELMEDVEDLDILGTPVGGGGLLSGTLLSAQYFAPQIDVYAAEPQGADDAYQSLQKSEIIPSINPQTIADGLLTSLGEKTYPIIKEYVKNILLVNDLEILEAMRMIWERMKIIIEPSCAVPLAMVLKNREIFQNKKVGIILTGGNVDLDTYFGSLTPRV